MLERVKNLLDQGLKNEDIARETGLSVRQVQRYKAALARCPEVPRSREELMELLRKKAQQGDLLAIRMLLTLPEPREEFNIDEAAKRLLTYFFHIFTAEERRTFKGLLRATIKRATRLQARGIEFPTQAEVEAEALAMQGEQATKEGAAGGVPPPEILEKS